MKRFRWLSLLGVWVILSGCATTGHEPARHLTGDPLIDGPNAIEHGPAKDKVLWQYRTATAAMWRGQYGEAKRLLDDALARIRGVIGADKSAKKSRGYFSAEAKKTFIGEPYERVMAYYFRGILYWMDGEPDNARACFRSAQLEDSDTVDKTYSGDYVLLDYLDGLATAKQGGDGSDALKRAQAEAKLTAPTAYHPKANVLFFVDFGLGPTKFASGQYAEQLMFRVTPSPAFSARIKIDRQTVTAPAYDDLYFQATTRGGRVMDHILANKAGLKRAADVTGNAALMSSAVLATQRETETAALGALAFGLLSKLTAAAIVPQADVRSWDNLPLFISFAAVELPAGPHTAIVEFLDPSNRVVPNLTKSINLNVPAGAGDKVVYVSDKSTTPQNL